MDDDVGHINVTDNRLSQSYCEGIKRITGVTNRCVLNFEIPKEILVRRQKSWKNLFDKYSQEFPDDVGININTLEPEDNLNEVLLEPCLAVQKTRQIQYWINTGESPYTHFLQGQSDTSFSSQNRKSSSSRCSSLSRSRWNDGGKLTQISSSSCSTVDTAVYILSNTNVTQKKQALAVLEGIRHCNLNFAMRAHYSSAQRTQYCKNKRLNIHKALTRTSNIRNSNLSSASDLHSDVMASKSTMANGDAYFKAHCDEAVKMESKKQVDVNLFLLEKEDDDIGQEAKIIDVNNVSTSTSKLLNNGIQHLNINNDSKAQSNKSNTEVFSDNEMFTFPGNCIANDVLKASHLSLDNAATQHANVNNNTTLEEDSSIEAEPISDDEIFSSPSKCKFTNAPGEPHWSLDNTAAEQLNTNNNSDSRNNSAEREKILTNNEIFQSLSSRSSEFSKSPHCKKLYTGRESPVDLAQSETLSLSRISQGEKSLHPALDPNIESTISHKRFKRKRKQRLLGNDANSEFYSDDCLTDSVADSVADSDSTQLFAYGNADSTSSASTQNQSPTPLKCITPILSVHETLSNNEKSIANDDNIYLTTIENREDQSPSVTNKSDNISTPLLEANENVEAKQLDGINDGHSSVVGAEQVQVNDAEHDALHIIGTIKNRAEAERKNINDHQTPVSTCRKNAEMSNNSCSKSFLCEVQNLDTDTVDSDQSTILLCECKVGSTLACCSDNLSFTDCSSCDDTVFLGRKSPVVAHDNFEAENLKPIVLLKRLDERLLDKKLVASKDVSYDVNKLSLVDKNSPNRYSHNAGNISKRRKLEPVVVLTRFEHKNGSSVKSNQLLPERSLNKECVRSSNGNVNKLFVDFSGSTPDKKQDQSDVDRKKNAEPVVVLQKLRFEDRPPLKDNELSCKRLVHKKQVVVDVNQTTSSPLSSKASTGKYSRGSTNSSEQSVNNVENRICTPLWNSRLRNLRRTESQLLSLLSSDQEDSSPKTQREEARATDKVLIERKNGLNCTTRRKSVRPSYSVKRSSRRSRRRLVQRRTTEHNKAVMMNTGRAILRLSVSQPGSSSPSSASTDSVPPMERTLLVSAPQSIKNLPRPNQADSSNNASGSRNIRNRLARSIYFQTRLNPDSDSELSTPGSSSKSATSTRQSARNLKTPLRLSKLNAVDSGNTSESTLQGRSFRPKRRNGPPPNYLEFLDTSDEEDLRRCLTERKRRARNRTKSFTATLLSDFSTKQRASRRRRLTVSNNTQSVFLDNADKEPCNVRTPKSGTLRKNRRSMSENTVKRITNESSRDSQTFPKKSPLSKTKGHASSLDGSS